MAGEAPSEFEFRALPAVIDRRDDIDVEEIIETTAKVVRAEEPRRGKVKDVLRRSLRMG